ncbi:MAG TPA: cytochrome c oxidase subunit II [Acidobacteriota bacterium]|nr:cytochrome c oxidase subunit II [Acidobacteriota bacterium]
MMRKLLGLPEAASAHAGDIDFMLVLLHWLILVLAIGWFIYFFYVLVRFRSSRNPRADYRGTRTHISSYVEGGVVIAEAILLLIFSIPLWSERVAAFPDESEAVVVRVVAEQFAWNVHYPGLDGVFGRTDVSLVDTEINPLGLDRQDPAARDDIVTLNQLRLPVGKPAIIHLSSKDVIHSFTLTEFRVKQDAIPGLEIPLWFTPTMTTAEFRERKQDPQVNFEIACAQLCGIGHYRMKGFFVVDTEADFEQWLAEQAQASQSTGEDDFWNQ